MPSNRHAGFGERPGETDPWQHEHRAPGRLNRLATLTRNDVQLAGSETTITMLAEPTPDQRQAFGLLGQPIPVNLRK